MLNKLHHVAIICSDYDKAKRFYVDTLELPLKREVYRQDRQDHILTLDIGGVEVELFIMPGHPERVTNPEANGLRHLAFHVADMEEAVAWLNARGIETEPIRLDPYTNSRMACRWKYTNKGEMTYAVSVLRRGNENRDHTGPCSLVCRKSAAAGSAERRCPDRSS